MPCYTDQYTTVDFRAVRDPAMLMKAIESLGGKFVKRENDFIEWVDPKVYGVGSILSGVMTIPEGSAITEIALKRAYSTLVMQSAAKKHGWTMTGSGQTFTMKKRAF